MRNTGVTSELPYIKLVTKFLNNIFFYKEAAEEWFGGTLQNLIQEKFYNCLTQDELSSPINLFQYHSRQTVFKKIVDLLGWFSVSVGWC
jgi:hypothetical protein